MSSVADVLELARGGKNEEAFALAMQMADSIKDNEIEAIKLSMFLAMGVSLEQKVKSAQLILPYLHNTALTVEHLHAAASVLWGNGSFDEAGLACIELLKREPRVESAYLILGMIKMCQLDFEGAFFVLGCIHKPVHSYWRKLAQELWQGRKEVTYQYEGKAYTFGLDIFGTQSLEAAATHLAGNFTEIKELELLRKFIPQGSRLVELGTLVGNHTLYFLKETKPASMILIDGCMDSINATKENISRNFGNDWPCPIRFVHRFVGLEEKECEFLGQTVRQEPFDKILEGEAFDFIKIDADGAEVELLDGAMGVIKANKPQIMIEVRKENRSAVDERLSPLGYRSVAEVDHGKYANIIMSVS